MLKKWSFLLVLALLVGLTGCGPSVMKNPHAKFPLAVSDKAPAFLFPINMSHAGVTGNPTAQGLAVTAGIAAKFGKTVISGQQLFDLVGNLSFELAEAISSQAHNQTWVMTGGAETVASGLANIMTTILNKLAALNLIPAGYKFKYIIALHSHGEVKQAPVGPAVVSISSWGGIYDTETKEILCYLESSDTVPNEEKSALVTLPLTYNKIIDHLLKGE